MEDIQKENIKRHEKKERMNELKRYGKSESRDMERINELKDI